MVGKRMQEEFFFFYFEFQFYNDFISIDYLILLHLYRLQRKVTFEVWMVFRAWKFIFLYY